MNTQIKGNKIKLTMSLTEACQYVPWDRPLTQLRSVLGSIFLFVLLISLPSSASAPSLQQKSLADLNASLAGFCTKNTLADTMSTVFSWDLSVIQTEAIIKDLLSSPIDINRKPQSPAVHKLLDAIEYTGPKSAIDPWEAQKLPFESIRLLGLTKSRFLHFEDAIKILSQNHDLKNSEFSTAKTEFTVEKLSKMEPDQQEDINRASSKVMKMAACSLLTRMNVLACATDLDRIIELMAPREDYTFLEGFATVLSNPSYREGLRLAALKILFKVQNRNIVKGDLFTDVNNSFRTAGIEKEAASEMTWTVMAVLATAGANTASRFMRLESPPETAVVKAAFAILASAISVLDSRTLGTRHLYSYPKEITTNCDNGKPYHFWMTAYLAHRLVKENGNVVAAAAASFTAQKGYEMMAQTPFRNPIAIFLDDAFKYTNNVIRMDLTFSGAAAWYGALSAVNKTPSLNLDEGLRQIMVASYPVKPLDGWAEAEALWKGIGLDGYNRWAKIFSPDTPYNYFEKSIHQ